MCMSVRACVNWRVQTVHACACVSVRVVYACVCVRVSACVRARACVRVCTYVYTPIPCLDPAYYTPRSKHDVNPPPPPPLNPPAPPPPPPPPLFASAECCANPANFSRPVDWLTTAKPTVRFAYVTIKLICCTVEVYALDIESRERRRDQ